MSALDNPQEEHALVRHVELEACSYHSCAHPPAFNGRRLPHHEYATVNGWHHADAVCIRERGSLYFVLPEAITQVCVLVGIDDSSPEGSCGTFKITVDGIPVAVARMQRGQPMRWLMGMATTPGKIVGISFQSDTRSCSGVAVRLAVSEQRALRIRSLSGLWWMSTLPYTSTYKRLEAYAEADAIHAYGDDYCEITLILEGGGISPSEMLFCLPHIITADVYCLSLTGAPATQNLEPASGLVATATLDGATLRDHLSFTHVATPEDLALLKLDSELLARKVLPDCREMAFSRDTALALFSAMEDELPYAAYWTQRDVRDKARRVEAWAMLAMLRQGLWSPPAV